MKELVIVSAAFGAGMAIALYVAITSTGIKTIKDSCEQEGYFTTRGDVYSCEYVGKRNEIIKEVLAR